LVQKQGGRDGSRKDEQTDTQYPLERKKKTARKAHRMRGVND